MAMPDKAGVPCAKPYCNWDDSNAHTLEVKTWTDDTQFSVVSFFVFVLGRGGCCCSDRVYAAMPVR